MFKTLNTADMAEPWTRWFIYGDTGTGKTSAASTFPRPLFLIPSVENSHETLRGAKFDYLIVRDWSSPFKESEGSGGMNAILTMIENEYKRAPDKFPFDTIVPDGLTHFSELLKDELTQGGKTAMDVQKYERLTSHFRNIHARLSNMDVHTVYISLGTIDENSKKGDAYLQKKAKEVIPSSCEVYAHMTVKDQGKNNPKIYMMHTQAHGEWKARTRYRKLPAEIKNFRFADIRHLLRNVDDVIGPDTIAESAETAAEEVVPEVVQPVVEQAAEV